MGTEKLGLALSGGGFRAAFFHIGVMSQLARAGLLREVEVISTVSGGSIIGAYYLLRLQRYIEESGQAPIPDDRGYVDLMGRIEEDFLSAVQKNVRMRTFADFVSNVKMIAPTYSRSDRLGELLDRHFYLPARKGVVGGKGDSIELKDLPEPRHGIPQLVINATSLNSGHAWRFGRETMGEFWPTTPAAWDIDRSDTYFRAPRYDDMIEKKTHFSLGKAVAASAAVPGLFHPLAVSNLYENRLQLVDGGVFDNQGIDALLYMGSTHVIVSDAGGQMGAIPGAPTSFLGVALRSSSIQYGRVRLAGLERLTDRLPRARIALIHILKGTAQQSHVWRNRTGTFDNAVPPDQRRPQETPSVDPAVQRLLADIRTDLDVFNEIEAMTLMLSGYRHAGQELEQASEIAALGSTTHPDPFKFEVLGTYLDRPPNGMFAKVLGAAKSRFTKLFKIRPTTAVVAGAVAYTPITLLVAVLAWAAWRFGPQLLRNAPGVGDAFRWLGDQFRDRPLAWSLTSLFAGLAVSYVFARYAAWTDRIPVVGGQLARTRAAVRAITNAFTLGTRALVAVLAFFVAWPSMKVMDRRYLRAGSVSKLEKPN